jgi:hypothetical protein
MLSFASLNGLAILVGLVAHMILGAVWFGVFAKPWARLAHPGKSTEELQGGPKWIYGVAAAGGLVTAIVLGALLDSLAVTRVVDAIVVTVALWVGFVLVKYATTYAFGARPTMLMLIDSGYPLVSMLAMGIIYAAWP